jgi:hypothetical protein
MKASELIEILSKLPPETPVIMSKDSEGNDYSPLYDVANGTVRSEEIEQYSVEYYSDEHTDSDCLLEPDERKGFTKVVCLWPMN